MPVIAAPLPEQHRIVEAIESYFSRLDSAVETLKRVQTNLKRYRASVLKAAVEGRLVPTEAELARAEGRDYEPAPVLLARILEERRRRWEESGRKGKYEEPAALDTRGLPELPEGWCWASLDQLSALIRNGYAHVPSGEEGVRILRISSVRPLSVDFSDVRFLPLPV